MPSSDILREHNPRVAIVMLSAIGDAVHVLPVANALRKASPGMKLTWVIQPVPHQLVHNHPAIDDFVFFKRRRGMGVFDQFAVARSEIRRRAFDLVIDLQVYFKAGLLTWFARAPAKLGFDRRRARDLNWLFTTEKIPPHENQHVQDQYFEFLDHMGVPHDPPEWGIVITEEEREAQRRFLAEIDKPVCSVVLGTSKPRKDWPAERYARLLEIIEDDFGFQPVIIGGPSAGERAAAEAVLAQTRAKPINMLGDDLRKLVYLIDGSVLVVSPDTGPLHVSRALETPVVGLYGYTNPKRSGPYRFCEDLVVDGYAGHPGEDYPITMDYRPEGMQRVTVEMVREKIELAVSSYVKA
jgi:heptosyltransferase I